MGMRPYQHTEKYVTSISQYGECIVEIGSERGEGSTAYFTLLAEKYKTKFYTVDINESIPIELDKSLLDKLIFYNMPGSLFAERVMPKLGRRIKVLYLDNFDWDWDPDIDNFPDRTRPDWMQRQIEWYAKRDLTLNNVASQTEHLKQMMYLLPFMSADAVIICDDTYRYKPNDAFTGKCGAVVPFLLANGYKIKAEDAGVILQR
jgi:hypothetical protein